jgi:hypothetical protein
MMNGVRATSFRLSVSTNNSNKHEGPLNSTSRFPYRSGPVGADSAEGKINAARARTVRFM